MLEIQLNAPLDVEWEITNACNLRCLHCYVAAGERAERELETSEAIKLINDLDNIGITDITISGGEPFLRRDLWRIIGEIEARKIPLMLYTNATLLNTEKVRKLAEHNVKSISVSLNGARAETHNFIQNANTFRKVLGAIKRLDDHGIKVQVSFTLMKVNVDEFDVLIGLSKKLNVSSICIYPLYPLGRGRENLDRLALDPKKTIEFLTKAVGFAQPPPYVFVGGCLGRKFTPTKKHSLIRGNPCGKLTALVTADGHFRPCNFLQFRTEHSVRERSIAELWNEPIFERVRNWRELMTKETDCASCQYLPICMGTCLSMHSVVSPQ